MSDFANDSGRDHNLKEVYDAGQAGNSTCQERTSICDP